MSSVLFQNVGKCERTTAVPWLRIRISGRLGLDEISVAGLVIVNTGPDFGFGLGLAEAEIFDLHRLELGDSDV